MKKLFAMVLLLALVSCNEEVIVPKEQMQEVCFNVATLDVEVEPMTRATVGASEVLTNIHYYIKNTTTNQVYSGTQTLTNAGADFGTIKMFLVAGTYEVKFFGYGTNNSSGSALMYIDNDSQEPRINLKNKDSFLCTQEISIEQGTTNVDINLTRLNGALVIRLNDEIPSEIGDIKVSFSYFPLWLISSEKATYEGNYGESTAFSDNLTISNSAVEEYTFYVLPQTQRTIKLTIYDNSNKELGSTSVVASFYKNKRTIIEGNILDIISQKEFAVTVTDDWDEDVVVPLE